MLTRLILVDFMAHHHTVLDFGPGLTVLVGPNNTGKSAVVEGLRCLVTNPPAQVFIRHGAREARVTAQFDDGRGVSWIRRPKSAGYELAEPGREPQEYWKLRQGQVPEDVQAVLGLHLVALETGDEVDVHLGDQKRPVFLLDEQKKLAPFFAAQAESGHLLAMQKRLKERVAEAKREEAAATRRQAELAASLDRLAGLPGLQLAAEELAREHQVLLATAQTLPRLESFRNTLLAARDESARLTARQQAGARLTAPPRLWPAESLARLLNQDAALRARLTSSSARLGALDSLVPAPGLFAAQSLARLLATLARLAADFRRATTRQAPLAGLRPAPALAPVQALDADLRQRRKLAARGAALEQRRQALAALTPPPAPVDIRPLAALLQEFRALEARREALAARLDGATRALARASERLAARLEELQTCPLCGSRLDPGHFGGEHGA